MNFLLPHLKHVGLVLSVCLLGLTGCDERDPPAAPQSLPLPERNEMSFTTDFADIAGQSLVLWQDAGKCRLQIRIKGKRQQGDSWLKPTAPCYFIKAPGTSHAQVFQYDKTTRVLAVVGSLKPIIAIPRPHCGQQVQGVLISAKGAISLTDKVFDGEHCVDKGLDNSLYSRLAMP